MRLLSSDKIKPPRLSATCLEPTNTYAGAHHSKLGSKKHLRGACEWPIRTMSEKRLGLIVGTILSQSNLRRQHIHQHCYVDDNGQSKHATHFVFMLLSWLRAGPPMLNATQPRAGKASSVSVPKRLSPAARVATSFAACAFPAASRVAAAVLHAAARVICSYNCRAWNQQLLSANI